MSESYSHLQTKIQQIQIESRQREKEKVSRKEYNEVLQKLIKCKKCLEKAIHEKRQFHEPH